MDDDALFATILLALGPPGADWFFDDHPSNPYGLRFTRRRLSEGPRFYKYRVKEMIRHLRPHERGKTRLFVSYVRWLGKNGAIDIRPLKDRMGEPALRQLLRRELNGLVAARWQPEADYTADELEECV